MNKEHQKDLIFSNGFNSLKMCRHGNRCLKRSEFYKNSTNIFGDIISINLLCFHSTSNINIRDLTPVAEPQDIPFD
jgi:hypothetical protein